MKTETDQKCDAKVLPLDQLYLSILVQVIEEDNLQAVQQDFGTDGGRLWLVSTGTTIPVAHILYKFDRDSVRLGVVTRDEREMGKTVKYAEGLDGFIQELQKFLRANRLAAPKKKAA